MDNKNILDQVNRRSGMTVPDGYFAEFASRMAASLPEQEWESAAPKIEVHRSVWQTIRPYVYMAAMFLGVWLMMNMFDFVRPSADLTVERNPVLAEAVSNDSFINEYFLDNADEADLMDDLWADHNQN